MAVAVALARARLASCSATAAEAILTTLPCSAPKRAKREGVDLDHRVLAGLDEADIEVGHQRLDLKPAADRREHDELLAGGDDLPDRRHSHLLDDAVRGSIKPADRAKTAGIRGEAARRAR